MRLLVTIVTFVTLLSFNAIGQSLRNEMPSEDILAAMGKLKLLTGKWEGKATIRQGPTASEVRQTEVVEFRMNKSALLIEGNGFDQEGNLVYEAMGLLVYNPFTQKYSIRAVRGNGLYIDAEVVVSDNQLQWTIHIPNGGKSRQTVKFSENTWDEVGEYSQDGENWFEYLSMSLKKVE